MNKEKDIDEFVKDIFEKSSSKGAHSYNHTRRVYVIAMKIGKVIGANQRVLAAAALMHDIGRMQEKETGISHSILSGEMSGPFLQKIGYSDTEIKQIIDAIRTHRFSEGLTPNSLEGEVLSDADKLDAIGAIGVFRAIAHTTETGKGIDAFLGHADVKLLKLKDLMYTEEGKRLAKIRHSDLEHFIKQLRNELEN
ncbi:MAG: HD domain-containing protein [Candidatus Thorarchaeota archaeon]